MSQQFVTDIFNFLIGEWTLHRTITPGGVFVGQGVFEPSAQDIILYHEDGLLTLDNGTVLEPTKKYRWRLEQGIICVHFDDGVTKGELFQTLDFTNAHVAQASHFCAPDDYVSEYHFVNRDYFEITHRVSGPKKSYTAQSIYSRSSP